MGFFTLWKNANFFTMVKQHFFLARTSSSIISKPLSKKNRLRRIQIKTNLKEIVIFGLKSWVTLPFGKMLILLLW